MDAPSGVVPARLSSFVNLSFSPLEPGNFYKRVYLLLRNQAPQVIHLYTGRPLCRLPLRS